jgi:hypothetical protein
MDRICRKESETCAPVLVRYCSGDIDHQAVPSRTQKAPWDWQGIEAKLWREVGHDVSQDILANPVMCFDCHAARSSSWALSFHQTTLRKTDLMPEIVRPMPKSPPLIL